MVATRSDAVDPVFAEVAKAVLGPDVDVRELWDISKAMPDTSAVSTPGSAGKNKKKALGAGLVLGTAAEASATTSAAQHAFPAAAGAAQKIAEPVTRVLSPMLSKVPKIPGGGGGKAHFALQATNFGVGLAAAHELLKKPKPAPGTGASPVAKRLVPVGDVDVTFVGQIAKFDTDKRQVFGWCSLSKVDGAEVIDLQGDYVPIEEMESSAYRYVLESRKGGDMHRRVKKGLTTNFDEPEHTSDLVESFVVTPEKLSKMGLAADALPLGWWVGFKVNDDAQWNLVKSGERTGFSIHGSGHRRPYDEIAKGVRTDKVKANIRARAQSARNPGPVKLMPVKSTAVKAVGYQKPTRRLAVQMHSRDEPYVYRASPKTAAKVTGAKSVGRAYTSTIRGQAKRNPKLTPADRVRTFASKPKETQS